MFLQKMTKDRVDGWRDQILGQRYYLSPLRPMLDETDSENTTPLLPGKVSEINKCGTDIGSVFHVI